jgi:hypothetical protein
MAMPTVSCFSDATETLNSIVRFKDIFKQNVLAVRFVLGALTIVAIIMVVM